MQNCKTAQFCSYTTVLFKSRLKKPKSHPIRPLTLTRTSNFDKYRLLTTFAVSLFLYEGTRPPPSCPPNFKHCRFLPACFGKGCLFFPVKLKHTFSCAVPGMPMSTPALKRHEAVHCSTFFFKHLELGKEFRGVFFTNTGITVSSQHPQPTSLLVKLTVHKQELIQPECKGGGKKDRKERFSNEKHSCGKE